MKTQQVSNTTSKSKRQAPQPASKAVIFSAYTTVVLMLAVMFAIAFAIAFAPFWLIYDQGGIFEAIDFIGHQVLNIISWFADGITEAHNSHN